MAARGSILKAEISKKIIDTFPNSFLYNDGKEIRINGTENGEPLQIKVTLTCAKVTVESDRLEFNDSPVATPASNTTTAEKIPQEPSQEEKERLATLLQNLGL